MARRVGSPAGVLLGLAVCFGFGLLLGGGVAHAQVSCLTVETLTFGSTAQNISDTDDGVDEDNRWALGGGADNALMLACKDGHIGAHTNGQQQGDTIGGGSGEDWFEGGTGDDTLRGGTSPPLDLPDSVFGGGGNDHMFDAETGDNDNFSGNDGNDVINVEDGDALDNAQGGAGTDTCPVDNGDNTSSCTPS